MLYIDDKYTKLHPSVIPLVLSAEKNKLFFRNDSKQEEPIYMIPAVFDHMDSSDYKDILVDIYESDTVYAKDILKKYLAWVISEWDEWVIASELIKSADEIISIYHPILATAIIMIEPLKYEYWSSVSLHRQILISYILLIYVFKRIWISMDFYKRIFDAFEKDKERLVNLYKSIHTKQNTYPLFEFLSKIMINILDENGKKFSLTKKEKEILLNKNIWFHETFTLDDIYQSYSQSSSHRHIRRILRKLVRYGYITKQIEGKNTFYMIISLP